VDLPKVRGDNPPAIAASMLPSYLDMDAVLYSCQTTGNPRLSD